MNSLSSVRPSERVHYWDKRILSKPIRLWNSVRCCVSNAGQWEGRHRVIKLTRINGDEVTVNSDQILYVEACPETTLTLLNGDRIKVNESVEGLCENVREFKRSVFMGMLRTDDQESGS